MSHAANIRHRHRSPHAESPAKRRKLSPKSNSRKSPNGVTALVNGNASDAKFTALPTQDAKRNERPRYDESRSTVRHAADDVDKSSSEASSSSDADADSSSEAEDEDDDASGESQDSDASEADGGGRANHRSRPSENHAVQHQEGDNEEEEEKEQGGSEAEEDNNDSEYEEEDEEDEEPQTATGVGARGDRGEEPSFGDLLRSNTPELIDVDASFEASSVPSKALATTSGHNALSVPSASSLGTVLTQALRTNDVERLESCLQVANLESIRATIERLHSSLATTLLQKLAERLHKRPGRAGSLMVWVQWTVVAHGGYLANQPNAMKELRTLYQVVKRRAAGLQPLLALKGKLDMLEAQMQLRHNMQSKSNRDDEEGIIYVEGEEESSDDETRRTGAASRSVSESGSSRRRHLRKQSHTTASDTTGVDDFEDEMMLTALPNGIGRDVVEQDEDGSSEEDEDLIDGEAEETEGTDDEDEEFSDDADFDDVDGGEEDEEEDSDIGDEEPTPKLSKSTKLSR